MATPGLSDLEALLEEAASAAAALDREKNSSSVKNEHRDSTRCEDNRDGDRAHGRDRSRSKVKKEDGDVEMKDAPQSAPAGPQPEQAAATETPLAVLRSALAYEFGPMPQQSQYSTPAYAQYDPWLVPRSATDNSPASAPTTGPTSPEYPPSRSMYLLSSVDTVTAGSLHARQVRPAEHVLSRHLGSIYRSSDFYSLSEQAAINAKVRFKHAFQDTVAAFQADRAALLEEGRRTGSPIIPVEITKRMITINPVYDIEPIEKITDAYVDRYLWS
ncbi:uncharacterized protein BDZ99DRAFT_514095 [Mytilinidion resinicola]|uniref:Uncharacterized protein n=1 Tax=Mytilinidion resinicola TaxID=574789 RepID=A0A6A6ZA37_9PEZI|nr:uncharacterized protein BDZ99DRAFT_514095 [Mytilinidion resinicola]KAF2817876.1 hypothetical protein BDZ99DRAFT_514095 [Mytilinidion resinicola]